MNEEVGLVLGTKDASPLEFWVGVLEGKYLELDDIVEVSTEVPGKGEKVTFYGVVDHVRKLYEGAQFDSDTLLVGEGLIPIEVSYAAFIKVTRVEPEIYIPPHPGDKVFRSTSGIEKGLYFDRMTKKLPVGIMRNGNVVYSNLEFINGEKGGHLSISGISGVATKTSYALFFLYSLFNSGVLGRELASTHAIIFNVKGEDLLFLDKPNSKLKEEEREKYKILGLPSDKPFEGVKFYAPVRPYTKEIEVITEKRKEGIKPYFWTVREIAKNRILRFLFSTGGEEEISTLMHAVRKIEDRLYELSSEGDNYEPLKKDSEEINTLFDLKRSIESDEGWWFGGGNVASQTISAFLRRLDHAARSTSSIIRPLPKGNYNSSSTFHINWEKSRFTIIDINRLDSYSKMFVVGVIINEIFKKKEKSNSSRPLVFIMLDELNKYAPRTGWSPIKELLLDIAERGRSLGIILIGAQQTASEIEKRIFANSAIKVVGRLDPAESERTEYDFLTPTLRKRAIMINSGTMIYHQPDVPVSLLLRFPFPLWATKKEEVEDDEGNLPDFF
ncbi:MAG TPA: ATP-binding protein [Candidatus Atribacteria bacterium]|nr:ATP-binding protein [Candidatus Atribacteria bacterium]